MMGHSQPLDRLLMDIAYTAGVGTRNPKSVSDSAARWNSCMLFDRPGRLKIQMSSLYVCRIRKMVLRSLRTEAVTKYLYVF